MKNLKHYFTLTFAVLLMLVLSIPALAQGEKAETLVGHWTFERGEELEDHTGHFGDIELNGGAEVEKGQLVLGANKWAITTGYKGPEIKEKTLAAWVYIDDLDITHGAPIAIQQTDADSFDAIVYAERQPRQWMAGSSNFKRTQDADPGFKEKETGKLVYMAISYEDDGGQAHVRIYRNSELIGDYTQGAIATWVAGNVEALFGLRK